MSLGKRLAELRRGAGMTQTELGKRLSITAQAISKWENDTAEPDISTIKRIAEIYGITVAEIIDPDNVGTEPRAVAETPAVEVDVTATADATDGGVAIAPSIHSSLYDVYLTEAGDSKVTTINYIMKLLGIGLAEAKTAVESLPYLISGDVSPEECERIASYLGKVGAKVEREPATGMHPYRKILSTEAPKPPKESHDMIKRFITANLTAAIPAILILVFNFMYLCKQPIDIPLIVYCGIATYCLIFQLWYPTLTRKLLSPIGMLSFEGIIKSLGDIVIIILFIPWIIIVGLLSPINYAFTIKKRVVRMLDEDDEDDIFGL